MVPGEQASGTGRAEVDESDSRALVRRQLGGAIRRRRHAASLTLATVSERAGISVSMLSQVERGLLDPSLDTLRNIADALGTAPFRLLAEEGPVAGVVRRGERRDRHGRGRRTSHSELLSPSAEGAFAITVWELQPGESRLGDGAGSSAGEEANVLLQGARQAGDRRRADRARHGRLRDLRSALAASRDRDRARISGRARGRSARPRPDCFARPRGDLRSAQAGAIMCDSQRISAWVKAGRTSRSMEHASRTIGRVGSEHAHMGRGDRGDRARDHRRALGRQRRRQEQQARAGQGDDEPHDVVLGQ